MAEEFDPYRKWLGIPPAEQPPHHYRLLGIALLEDDPDVIQNAADRQMAHVRTFQGGKHAAASQRILNELAAARVCLLNSQRKAEYDAWLQAQLAAPALGAPPLATAYDGQYPDAYSTEPEPPALPPPQIGPAGYAPPPLVPGAIPPVPAPTGYAPPPRLAPPVAVPMAEAPAPSMGVRTASASSYLRPRRTNGALYATLGILSVLGVVALVAVLSSLSPNGLPGEKEGRESASRKEKEAEPKTPPRSATKPPATGTVRPTPPSDTSKKMPEAGKGEVPLVPEPGGSESAAELVRSELRTARQALAQRDLALAHQNINTADVHAAQAPELKDEVEHWRVLHTYLGEFYAALNKSVRGEVKPGDTVRLPGSGEFRFVSWEDERLTFEVDGSRSTKAVAELPWGVALALARASQNPRDARGYVNLAAFLALDDNRDGIATRHQSRARALWREAARLGTRDAHLARELGLPQEVTDEQLAEMIGNEEDLGLVAGAANPRTPDENKRPANPMPETGPPAVVKENAPGNLPALADERTLIEARERFKRMHAPLLSAAASRTPEQRANALEVLRAFAADEKTERVLRYVTWERMRDFALEMGEAEPGLLAIDAMAGEFQIDALREKLTLLQRMGARAGLTPEAIAAQYEAAGKLFQEAKSQQRYRLAVEWGELTERLARRAKKLDALKTLGDELLALKKLAADEDVVTKALADLKANPGDPQANFVYGRHLCFRQGDWSRGLPHLAQGSDAELRDLAQADRAAPAASDAQRALADRWFTLAQLYTGDPAHKPAVWRRAEHWYKQAVANLTGDNLRAVQQRLEELQTLLAGEKPVS